MVNSQRSDKDQISPIKGSIDDQAQKSKKSDKDGELLVESKEQEDEVNQLLDKNAQIKGVESQGNLNVQNLIESQRNRSLGSRGKPVRPQSGRPLFRPNFLTLDPNTQRIQRGMERDKNFDILEETLLEND